jgi:hypothetical protein
MSRIRTWLLFARLTQVLGRSPRTAEVIEWCNVTGAAARRMIRAFNQMPTSERGIVVRDYLGARGAILGALQSGLSTTRAVAEHIGIDRKTVQIRLSELALMGVVYSTPQHKGRCRGSGHGPGRPEHTYRIRA